MARCLCITAGITDHSVFAALIVTHNQRGGKCSRWVSSHDLCLQLPTLYV
jgi:hypothetical protein